MDQPAADTAEPGAYATDDVFEAMGTARAMRWLRPDPIPAAVIDRLLWAATRASNPSNSQLWDFVVVQDADLRARIGSLYTRFVEALDARPAPSAPSERVPDPDLATFRRTIAGARHLMATMGDAPAIVFVCAPTESPDGHEDSNYLYSAAYAAGQNLIVAARALGLGSVFTTLHLQVEPELRTLLRIPADRGIRLMIPLGWPARPFGPLTRKPVEDVVHHDGW